MGTWHEVLKQVICGSGARKEFLVREQELVGGDSEAQRTLYDEVYPDYAEIALLGRDEPPFHALVVDEAQDLIGSRRLSVIDLLIRGGLGGGRWCMFGDFTRQALYNRDTQGSRDPVMDLQAYGGRVVDGTRQRGLEFVKARLTRNCRNTRSIAEHTAMIAGFETPPFKTGAEVGIDVDYRYWGSSRGGRTS